MADASQTMRQARAYIQHLEQENDQLAKELDDARAEVAHLTDIVEGRVER